MNDRAYVVFTEHLVDRFPVGHVYIVNGYVHPCNFFDSADDLRLAVTEIVRDNRIKSSVYQLNTGVAANIAGSSGQ